MAHLKKKLDQLNKFHSTKVLVLFRLQGILRLRDRPRPVLARLGQGILVGIPERPGEHGKSPGTWLWRCPDGNEWLIL